jgi:hypothetical protein
MTEKKTNTYSVSLRFRRKKGIYLSTQQQLLVIIFYKNYEFFDFFFDPPPSAFIRRISPGDGYGRI